jgi:hypothetical protein
MYGDYGLQVAVSMDGDTSNGGTRFSRIPKRFTDCTVEDFEALTGNIQLRPCSHCAGGVRLVGSRPEDEKANLCEPCWIADWREAGKPAAARRAQQQAARDRRMLARGFTHRVDAWVHDNGNDKQVILYRQDEPTRGTIEALVRRKGSDMLGDYTVTALTTPVATTPRIGHA